MSLDCYPLTERRLIALDEQPMAIDAAYASDLLVTVVDDCQTVVVLDLNQASQSNLLVGRFQLGDGIVIDQVVHCNQGDFIACVGHKEGKLTLYAVFDWRRKLPGEQPVANGGASATYSEPQIEELNLSEMTIPLDEVDRSDKLNGIDVCQSTGNLAASYGDLVIIYRYVSAHQEQQQQQQQKQTPAEPGQGSPAGENSWHEITSSPEDLANDLDKLLAGNNQRGHFKHMVSLKLSLWAARISLVENYLSIMASDHVQVLKLELLTLQIQSEGQEAGSQAGPQQQVSRSAGSSGESQATAALLTGARGRSAAKAACGPKGPAGAKMQPVAGDTRGARETTSGDDDEDRATNCTTSASSSCSSLASGFSSNQSIVTNFSSFLGADAELEGGTPSGGATSTADAAMKGNSGREGETSAAARSQAPPMSSQIDSDLSIITMQSLHQTAGLELGEQLASPGFQDDCVTWNLNTKKLVKLPTLMHNTSTDLASYHICHPLELLGPASESIACRVSARIYAPDLAQNQLEPVVLLCRQFDFDRDPIKLTQLEPVYLSPAAEDQRRLGAGVRGAPAPSGPHSTPPPAVGHLSWGSTCPTTGGCPWWSSSWNSSPGSCVQLLKSRNCDLLASVSFFVASLANCYIYSLAGKKVARLQTITFPGLCLDLRADLLNVHLLTPLGLQVCSTSTCDATYRYEWSSSADLNLSFLARDRVRVLTTRHHLIMVSACASSAAGLGQQVNPSEPPPARLAGLSSTTPASFLEILRKPSLGELFDRIGHTVARCQSISVRSNLLTYLHASAQLSLLELEKRPRQDEENRAERKTTEATLKEIGLLLAKQLLQKKQTNVITNSRIDKAIKHLLDISFCDLAELLQRYLMLLGRRDPSDPARNFQGDPRPDCFKHDASVEEDQNQDQDRKGALSCDDHDDHDDHDEDDEDDEQPEDSDFELLKIYLRHSKFSQCILDYLKSLAMGPPEAPSPDGSESTETSSRCDAFEKLISYMFDHNPRLLIKCAQRITRDSSAFSNRCRGHLVEKLQQLAEFDSTGINRATVLFTLAIQRHQEASTSAARDQSQCLQALSQIKPQNHLAITMCSNHEIISESMARLVEEHHPQVFRLFLSQLERRGDLEAAREFRRLTGRAPTVGGEPEEAVGQLGGGEGERSGRGEWRQGQDGEDGKEEKEESQQGDSEDEDEDEVYGRTQSLLAEVSPLELAEFFCSSSGAAEQGDQQAMRAYLKASINLMESRYILARLCENSR